jgi:hypothetical protein
MVMFYEKLMQRYRPAVVAVIYLVLTIVLTYPLAFVLKDHIVGTGTADIWQQLRFPGTNISR